MRSAYSLICFWKVRTRIYQSIGIPEPPILGSFGSPPMLEFKRRGVFIRLSLSDAGALALIAVVELMPSIICWFYVLCVLINSTNCAVSEFFPSIRWDDVSLECIGKEIQFKK